MKRVYLRRFLTVCLMVLAGLQLRAQTYDSLWKQIDEARSKGLPQRVMELAGRVADKAVAERQVSQLLKATLCREAVQEALMPDSLFPNVQRMEQWAGQETRPVERAILHSLLAGRYADWGEANRWKLMQNSHLDVEEGDEPADMREGSFRLLLRRIRRHVDASLADVEPLMKSSSGSYLPFVLQGADSRHYGHDMYHLLLRRAVDIDRRFHSFLAEDDRMLCRIDTLYQTAIRRYREQPGAEEAVLLLSLDEAEWQMERQTTSVAPYLDYDACLADARQRYLQRLDALAEEFGPQQLAAEIYLRKARLLSERARPGDLPAALHTCDEGIRRYAAYARINALKQVREQLTHPAVSLHLEEAGGYPGDSLPVRLTYTRASAVTLRLYATDFAEVPEEAITRQTYRQHARCIDSRPVRLLPQPKAGYAAEEWGYLPSDTTLTLALPSQPGVYIVRLLSDRNEPATETYLALTRLKVLTLNLGNGQTEFCVVDACSGHPVEGAVVNCYGYGQGGKRELLAEVTTDAGGKALIDRDERIRTYVARKGDDRAMPSQSLYLLPARRHDGQQPVRSLTLLTDRALYRPGQTVYVKGVAYSATEAQVAVTPDREYELQLLDVNRKVIASRSVRTGDFGSFATEFVLPSHCLNGRFTLRTGSGEGSASIRVEEYRRPTFEISFDPVSEPYRVGDRLFLTGRVKTLHGMPASRLPIAYTVTRSSDAVGWGAATQTPLQSDTLLLDDEGRFTLPCTLERPVPSSPYARKHPASATYRVDATVTDEAGETQTATCTLQADGHRYFFRTTLPQQLCKEDSLSFTVRIENAQQVPQPLAGYYRLYREGEERVTAEGRFQTNRPHDFSAWRNVPSGCYRLELSVLDSLGREVPDSLAANRSATCLLYSRRDVRLPYAADLFCEVEQTEFDAEQPAVFLVGTSHRDVCMWMDLFDATQRIESRSIQLSDTLMRMEIPYQPRYGEGVTILFSLVKEGKLYERQVRLQKRRPERTLQLKWEVFRDRLRPGSEEEWRLVLNAPQGGVADAELLALMYDASLDLLAPHRPSLRWTPSTRYFAPFHSCSGHHPAYLALDYPWKRWKIPGWSFDSFYTAPVGRLGGRGVISRLWMKSNAAATTDKARLETVSLKAALPAAETARAESVAADEEDAEGQEEPRLLPDADVRTNFAETAFFYPHLRTDSLGRISFAFTMPQSLTRWNFRGIAHTRDMMTGRIEAGVVTAKEFMLTPNLPRFVRTGDRTHVAATVANLSDRPVKGVVHMTLFDPLTERVLTTQKVRFRTEAGGRQVVDFAFEADGRLSLLGIRLVADGGAFSDGEQQLLPVLSDRVAVTETLPFTLQGGQKRNYALDSLFNHRSPTATRRHLTLELTGNPAWLAVQALPSLSLPTTDNAVAWATAFYANSLAASIVGSQPRLQAVIERWKQAGNGKESFLSRLEQNQELKNILLDESPWVMEATDEADRKARLSTLFDVNQLANRLASSLTSLQKLQEADGSWCWYKGMPGHRQLTGYITALLLRLPQLTGEAPSAEQLALCRKAFGYLHRQAREEYLRLRKMEKKGHRDALLSDAACHYLYLIALGQEKVPGENKAAYTYFLDKVGQGLENGSILYKAKAAFILWKAGRKREAADFQASIREHLVRQEGRGAWFAFHDAYAGWGMWPVSIQVAAMEALALSSENNELLEEMKIWLLRQKQTTSWNSPVATADAIYALMGGESRLLESRGEVSARIGNETLTIRSEEAEAGLAYVKRSYADTSSALQARTLTVEKQDDGMAWGALYAQYLSPIADLHRQSVEELQVEKRLYVERMDPTGRSSLQPLTAASVLKPGEKVVTRLVVRVGQATDFVQLKDARAACLEPIQTRSGYRWGQGTGYYMEIEDAATHLFFDRLAKGVYVFEYSCRVARSGRYEAGVATLQSAYAPAFAARSDRFLLQVSE